MSGGGKTQTSTTSAEPYKAAKPLYDWGMKQGLDMAKAGTLAQPNTMSTVVPFSQQTMAGMGNVEQTAQNAMAPGGYQSQMNDIVNAGGFNQPQQTALQGITQTATQPFDINSNPAFMDVLNRATQRQADQVNLMASGMGRTGSGAHQGVLARETGDLTARMIGDEYRNWQGRQDAAQGALFTAGQQGMNNMSGAFDAQMDPSRALMGVGGMYEDLYGRTLNDQLRITNETQNAPLANLQALMALAGGAGAYGTNTQSAQMPGNMFSGALGGALGGYGMMQNPYGAIGGGLLGALSYL